MFESIIKEIGILTTFNNDTTEYSYGMVIEDSDIKENASYSRSYFNDCYYNYILGLKNPMELKDEFRFTHISKETEIAINEKYNKLDRVTNICNKLEQDGIDKTDEIRVKYKLKGASLKLVDVEVPYRYNQNLLGYSVIINTANFFEFLLFSCPRAGEKIIEVAILGRKCKIVYIEVSNNITLTEDGRFIEHEGLREHGVNFEGVMKHAHIINDKVILHRDRIKDINYRYSSEFTTKEFILTVLTKLRALVGIKIHGEQEIENFTKFYTAVFLKFRNYQSLSNHIEKVLKSSLPATIFIRDIEGFYLPKIIMDLSLNIGIIPEKTKKKHDRSRKLYYNDKLDTFNVILDTSINMCRFSFGESIINILELACKSQSPILNLSNYCSIELETAGSPIDNYNGVDIYAMMQDILKINANPSSSKFRTKNTRVEELEIAMGMIDKMVREDGLDPFVGKYYQQYRRFYKSTEEPYIIIPMAKRLIKIDVGYDIYTSLRGKEYNPIFSILNSTTEFLNEGR